MYFPVRGNLLVARGLRRFARNDKWFEQIPQTAFSQEEDAMAFRKKETAPVTIDNIALWGPYASGKSWLLCSFPKDLEYYNRLNDQENQFFYSLREYLPGKPDPLPVIPGPPVSIMPAPHLMTFMYRFNRVPRTLDRRLRSSAQDHEVLLSKIKWKDLVQGLDDPENFAGSMNALVQAQNHVIALGIPYDEMMSEPPMVPGLEQPDPMMGFSHRRDSRLGIFIPSQDELVISMQGLLQKLGTQRRCNLAFCLTKADQLKKTGSPWDLLEYRHGRKLRNLLELYRKFHNIQVFVTSAAGYLQVDGRVVPNIAGGELIDPNCWQPVNTAAPFFWIFEQLEHARLQKNFFLFRAARLKNYIPYPRPRAV